MSLPPTCLCHLACLLCLIVCALPLPLPLASSLFPISCLASAPLTLTHCRMTATHTTVIMLSYRVKTLLLAIECDIGIVTTHFPASCSTHAVPPLFRFFASFCLSLTRQLHVGLISLISDLC